MGTKSTACLVGLFACAFANAALWTFETAYDGSIIDPPSATSLKVDSAGQPFLVYGGDKLRQVRANGIRWDVSVIDTNAEVGMAASLALGAGDAPCIAYCDKLRSMLKCAQWIQSGTNGSWRIEQVDRMPEGSSACVRLDSLGRPHIVFTGPTALLRYAVRDEAGWHLSTIASNCQSVSSLALRTDDSPDVAYASGGGVYHAHAAAGVSPATWSRTMIAAINGYAAYPAIAVNAQNRPRIAYVDSIMELGSYNFLMHAWYDGSGWLSDAVAWTDDYTLSAGKHISLALDASDNAYISYYRQTSSAPEIGDVRLVRYSVSQRSIVSDVILATGFVARSTSVALDASSSPRVSYMGGLSLGLSTYNGTSWSTAWPDVGVSSSMPVSLALDASGQPHMACFHKGRGSAFYIWRQSGLWRSENVPSSSGYMIGVPSVAVSKSGVRSIAFHHQGTDTLRFATRNPDGSTVQWSVSSLATGITDDVFLRFDNTNQPHIAFINDAPSEVRHMARSGSVWRTETVRGAVSGFDHLTLAMNMDSAGVPRFAFIERGTPGYVAYAYPNPGGSPAWFTEWVRNLSDAEFPFLSLVLNASDRPYIAFCSDWTNGLQVLGRASGVWSAEKVVTNYCGGGGYSLAVNDSGNLHVAYWEYMNLVGAAQPGLARRLPAGWDKPSFGSARTPAASWEWGPALAIDAEGGVHVAYYDGELGDVVWAYKPPLDLTSVHWANPTQCAMTWVGETNNIWLSYRSILTGTGGWSDVTGPFVGNSCTATVQQGFYRVTRR